MIAIGDCLHTTSVLPRSVRNRMIGTELVSC
jgi:hypothetical protein